MRFTLIDKDHTPSGSAVLGRCSRRRRPALWSSECAYPVRKRTTAEGSCPSILSEINESPRGPNWGGPPGHHLVSRASIFASPLILPPGKFVASKSFVAPLDYSGSAGLFCAING